VTATRALVRDIGCAIEDEHCACKNGFGASDTEIVAPNYELYFTPHGEYLFAFDAAFEQPQTRTAGNREKKTIKFLRENAVSCMQEQYKEMGWDIDAVTDVLFQNLKITDFEIGAMRM